MPEVQLLPNSHYTYTWKDMFFLRSVLYLHAGGFLHLCPALLSVFPSQ